MNIRGMIRFSLVDYPGKIACVLFVGDCNMRCPFCHNPHLVLDPGSQPLVREAQALNFLKTRVGKLEGVVISGGEPTLRKKLPEFAAKLVEMGFKVKLDTNGSMPSTIKALYDAGLVHALGVDYKAPSAKYAELTKCKTPEVAAKVAETIQFALEKNLQLDVRTTVHRSLLSTEDLALMRAELNALGVKDWALQQFNPVEVMDVNLDKERSYSDLELFEISCKLGNGTKARGLTGVYIEK